MLLCLGVVKEDVFLEEKEQLCNPTLTDDLKSQEIKHFWGARCMQVIISASRRKRNLVARVLSPFVSLDKLKIWTLCEID